MLVWWKREEALVNFGLLNSSESVFVYVSSFDMAERRIGSDVFEVAAEEIKILSKTPDNQELLDTYMYYKQVIVGDCNTTRPGILDMKGKAKWDAWNSIKGMTKEEADKLYVEYVDKLKEKYGLSK